MSLMEAVSFYGEEVVRRAIEKLISFEEAAEQLTQEEHERYFQGGAY